MGLYRTIPQDVEAVQFTGMKDEEPILKEMGSSIPSWLWRGITKGMVKFDTIGVKVGNTVLKEGDWIIFDGAFIDAMSDEKFNSTFVPARKPLSEMISAPKPKARMAKQPVTQVPTPTTTTVSTATTPIVDATTPALMANAPKLGVAEEIPDEVDAIMSKIVSKPYTIDMAEPAVGGAE